ncbi:Hypothetical protein PHPALM_12385 [Phytophthora palmivora]|uniref:Uncharacterized protein n=1 Tax=Phytophthora palmivora TaxID=4796 RepID=A0A2P4XZV5_9STRA|nr:Hypothetical protein PHPALM_12385 [Phytophthora palmivora]
MSFTQVKDDQYKCTTCDKQYKNLNRNHEGCEQELKSPPLGLHLVCQQTIWIYIAGLIECRLTRLNAFLSNESKDTVSRYISLLFELVALAVFCELSDLFVLVLDGRCCQWCWKLCCNYHDDLECSSRKLLLTFYPVQNEEELSAHSQCYLIADTLSRYNKPWSTVKLLMGDNCSVNQHICKKDGAIPLVGCASHIFNLMAKDFLKTDSELIAKFKF